MVETITHLSAAALHVDLMTATSSLSNTARFAVLAEPVERWSRETVHWTFSRRWRIPSTTVWGEWVAGAS